VRPTLLAAALSLGGCKDKAPVDDTGPSNDGLLYELVGDDFDHGVLLAAWEDGDRLRVVGGSLGGGVGHQVTIRDSGSVCQEGVLVDQAQWWIHGAEPGSQQYYTVGEQGSIYSWNDRTPTDESVDSEATFYGVYDDGTVVWAVGGDPATGLGEVWARGPSGWELQASEIPGILYKVWDGWIVGDQQALRMVGGELEATEADTKLLTVRGRDAGDDVWAVGGTSGAEVRHWSGSAWEEVGTDLLGVPLSGVWTAPEHDVYVAGSFGTMARLPPDSTEWQMPDLPLTSDDFHAVYPFGDEIWYVGGNLLTSGTDYHGTIAREGETLMELELDGC